MAVPSLKTPRIVNADKPGIVTDPGTLVWNNDTDQLEVVNNANAFVPTGGGGGIPANVIHQQLWINATDGSDSNDGGEYTPFASYAAATAFAALSASPTNKYLIRVIGDLAATTPVLYPYIDLLFSNGIFTVTGGWTLDASWDTVVSNEVVTIEGMKLAGFWSFSWVGNSGNIIRFLNCDHSLTTSGNFLSNPGSANILQIINDTSPLTTSYSGNLFITNSASFLFNMVAGSEIRYDLVTDGYTIDHYLLNSTIVTDILLKKTVPNTSTQVVHVRNTPMPVGSPVLEDVDSTVEIDTDSYLSDPSLLLSGTLANIVTKGVNGIRQQLWVNANTGNDLNNGSPNAPMATYDAARTLAQVTASPTNRFLINVVGDLTLAGDFNLNPYIDLNFIDSTVTINGSSGVFLDPSFTVSNEKIYISGFKPITNVGLNLIFTAGTGNWITFNNPNFSQCDNGFIYNPAPLNDNGISIFNDTSPTTCFNTLFWVIQAFSTIEGVNFGGEVRQDIFDDDFNMRAVMYNCTANTIVQMRTSGNSVGTLYARNVKSNSGFSVASGNWTLNIDSDSYNVVAVSNDATYANIVTYNTTDGEILGSMTPANFSFVSGNYPSNALTGYIQGIDDKLGALTLPYIETSNLTNVMSPNTEYTANNAAVVSLTLPINAAVGDTIRVNGKGSGGFRIDQQNAGHVIHVGAASTTVGPTGSLASATQFASITLRCITTDDVWTTIGFAGTFTPV